MGIKLVLVHGFRPQVERAAARPRATRRASATAMRITDAVALDCAQEAAGQLRFEIEAAFSQGLPNTPMANATVRVVSGNFLTARPVGIVDGVDFMHSGVVRKVDAAAIRRAIDSGAMVLLSPFGFSPTGEAFNLTMEDVATSTRDRAAGRQAAVRHRGARHPRRPDDPESADRHRARAGRCRAAADARCPQPQPTEQRGVLPAPLRQAPARAASSARTSCRSRSTARILHGGVHARRHRHHGGRREAREPARGRPPTTSAASWQLIEPFERDGTLVKRGRTEIERDIGNYTVIEHDGVIFGCAALYPYPEARTGEMAALTVSPQRAGPGRRRADAQARRAARQRSMGLESIFVLTTRTMHWFIKRGFAAGRRRLAARGAQAQIQLGPALAGAGQETGLNMRRIDARSDWRPNMARTVQCAYLKKDAEGLDFPPTRANSASASTTRSARRPGRCGSSTRRCWSTKTA